MIRAEKIADGMVPLPDISENRGTVLEKKSRHGRARPFFGHGRVKKGDVDQSAVSVSGCK